MLATGLIVAYGYVDGSVHGLVQRQRLRSYHDLEPHAGPYAPFYWTLIFCNILTPQVLWFKRIRTNPVWLFARFDRGEHRHVAGAFRDRRHQPAPDFLPSSWGMY